jgi:hypothetical protein
LGIERQQSQILQLHRSATVAAAMPCRYTIAVSIDDQHGKNQLQGMKLTILSRPVDSSHAPQQQQKEQSTHRPDSSGDKALRNDIFGDD